MKVLFITRKFPPSVGGMENVAAGLYQALTPNVLVKLIKYGGANKYLPVIYPWLFAQALFYGLRFRPDIIYVQDGVMAPMAIALRALLNVPVVATIHGTEMVFKNPIYTKTVIPAIDQLDGVAVISRATGEKVAEQTPGVPHCLIHWGVNDDIYIEADKDHLRQELSGLLSLPLDSRPLICLVGRLIERKGALWFVENVMPLVVKSVPNIACVVAGRGEEEMALNSAVERLGLKDNVYLVGYVLGEGRRLLFNSADLFIMPNRAGFGFEGFGMVAVEASSCGTPVVAGSLAGVTDAVVDGETGWLLPVDDVGAYAERLISELKTPTLKRAVVRQRTLETYDWGRTAADYIRFFEETIAKRHHA